MENIVLFGRGKYFFHKRNIVEKYHVICIIDNVISREKSEVLQNKKIRMTNPRDLDKNGTEKIYLMSMHFISMWRQLMEMGIDPGRLVYPFFEKPYFQSDSVIIEYIEEICFEIDRVVVKYRSGEIEYVYNEEGWYTCLRSIYRKHYLVIDAIASMETTAVSNQFATERGTPIDREYIGRFLEMYTEMITGDVLEIEDSTYTKQYGKELKNAIVMDVSSKAPWIDFNADIESGAGIRDEVADCFILTQTLMYIFDLKSAAHNICRLLKKGGYALITCSGISQNSQRCMEQYGSYYNFNAAVFSKMFADEDAEVMVSGSYGNVKTVTAHIAGLCREDLKEEDFIPNDKYYPLIVYAVVKKNE